MASKALVPKNQNDTGLRRQAWDESPLMALQQQMNRLFDGFFKTWSGLGTSEAFSEGLSRYTPRIDVTETDKTLEVSAEMPGMSDKDVEVTLSSNGNVLQLRGEKKVEREHKERGYYHSERSFGSFQRQISLPCAVEQDKVQATFKDGILHITLPKQASQRQGAKRITVKTA